MSSGTPPTAGTTKFFTGTAPPFTQLTDNTRNDAYPQVHNGRIVWHGHDGNDYEIYYWDGTTVQPLTDNDYADGNPQIHNGQVVWTGSAGGADTEIFFWDGSTIRQLTDNAYLDDTPRIHNGRVVWLGFDGNDNEIFTGTGPPPTS